MCKTTSIQVGYMQKPWPVRTVEAHGGTYLAVGKTEEWVRKACTVFDNGKSPLRSCKIFEQLQTLVRAQELEEDPMLARSALAEGDAYATPPKKEEAT